MLRVVRCTLFRHCYHCHSHYQKCWCRIHLLRCLRRNHHPILYHLAMYNVYLARSAENLCGHDACGGGDGCDGGDGSSVSLLHTKFCVIGAFCFAGFISSSGNCCPLNHKGTSSTSVFQVHREVQGSIYVSQPSVQCLYW